MNDYSIAQVSPKPAFAVQPKSSLAKRLVYRLLGKLQLGGISLLEEGSRTVFGEAGCPELDGTIIINDPRAYGHIVRNGVLGAGEAYILGWWSSPDLVSVIRVFSANMQTMQAMDKRGRVRKLLKDAVQSVLSKNTLIGSKKNIVAHYDLSNEFFASFLDSSMMYSSAIFPKPDSTLEEAAEYKLKHICDRLQLTADDHLLEIGTGWGGLACYAALNCGCRITTTTISNEQFAYARSRVQELGLEDRVTLLDWDYRNLTGQYDKLVSVEMIEAVGHEYYTEYFSTCSRLLKPNGLMLLQAITIADQRYQHAKNSIDFIKKYIFPGGCLPSNSVIAAQFATSTDMQVIGVEDIGQHYADTLAHWRQRFLAAADRLDQFGFDERFKRMWEYYLCYCEGGFRERIISTVQVLAAKPQNRTIPEVTRV